MNSIEKSYLQNLQGISTGLNQGRIGGKIYCLLPSGVFDFDLKIPATIEMMIIRMTIGSLVVYTRQFRH